MVVSFLCACHNAESIVKIGVCQIDVYWNYILEEGV